MNRAEVGRREQDAAEDGERRDELPGREHLVEDEHGEDQRDGGVGRDDRREDRDRPDLERLVERQVGERPERADPGELPEIARVEAGELAGRDDDDRQDHRRDEVEAENDPERAGQP